MENVLEIFSLVTKRPQQNIADPDQTAAPSELSLFATSTVKPVLSGHSKIDKTTVIKTNGSIMKVKSIAECSFGALCNTFDLH